MVMFARKVHRTLGGNFTFLVLTDRDDLDTQITRPLPAAGWWITTKDPCRAASGEDLRHLLAQHKAYVFSLIQKCQSEPGPGRALYRTRRYHRHYRRGPPHPVRHAGAQPA